MDTGQRAGLLTYLAIVNIRHKSRWKRLANRWVKPCKGLVPNGNAILVMYKAEVPQSQRCSMALFLYGAFVYRLVLQIFILARAVRLRHALQIFVLSVL